jgi:hypothetical protein
MFRWSVIVISALKVTLRFHASFCFTEISMLLNEKMTLNITKYNFSDPVYFIEGNRNYRSNNGGSDPSSSLTNMFTRTPYRQFWYNESGTINTENLKNHTRSQYYKENSNAPNFLMRYEGDFSSNSYGIESFANTIEGNQVWQYAIDSIPGITCTADYQFFSEDCSELNQIEEMNSNFRLDDSHISDYNLTEIRI